MTHLTWCENCSTDMHIHGGRMCEYCSGEFCFHCIDEHEKLCKLDQKEQ